MSNSETSWLKWVTAASLSALSLFYYHLFMAELLRYPIVELPLLSDSRYRGKSNFPGSSPTNGQILYALLNILLLRQPRVPMNSSFQAMSMKSALFYSRRVLLVFAEGHWHTAIRVWLPCTPPRAKGDDSKDGWKTSAQLQCTCQMQSVLPHSMSASLMLLA
jgi:hypothetical protein